MIYRSKSWAKYNSQWKVENVTGLFRPKNSSGDIVFLFKIVDSQSSETELDNTQK